MLKLVVIASSLRHSKRANKLYGFV